MVRTDLGDIELKALAAQGAQAFLLRWRARYAKHPKTADQYFAALSCALTWGVARGRVPVNPLLGAPRLYRCNRAERIWEAEHLEALYAHCRPETVFAIKLAVATGVRFGDLIRIPWSAVGKDALSWQTGKSRGRRTVVVPITDELRALLESIPRHSSSVTILNSAFRRPWTVPGLATAFNRIRHERPTCRRAA